MLTSNDEDPKKKIECKQSESNKTHKEMLGTVNANFFPKRNRNIMTFTIPDQFLDDHLLAVEPANTYVMANGSQENEKQSFIERKIALNRRQPLFEFLWGAFVQIIVH